MKLQIFWSAAVYLVISSCSEDMPSVQNDWSQVEMPSYEPFAKDLNLDEESLDRSYEGSLIVWAQDTDAKMMANVLNQSKEVKIIDSSFKSYKLADDKDFHRVCASRADLASVEKKLKSRDSFLINTFYAEQSDKGLAKDTSTWFEERLASDKIHDFENYCEALVWETAVLLLSDFNPRASYHRPMVARPSPLGICENYYQRVGIFTEKSCDLSKEPKGESYLACYYGASGVWATRAEFFKGKGASEKKLDQADLKNFKEIFKITDTSWQKGLKEKGRFILKMGMLSLPGKPILRIKIDGQQLDKILSETKISSFLDQEKLASTKLSVEDIDALREPVALEPYQSVDAGQVSEKYLVNDRLFNLQYFKPINDTDRLIIAEKSDLELRRKNELAPHLFGQKLPDDLFSSLDPEEKAKLERRQADLKADLLALLQKRKSLAQETGFETNKTQWFMKKAAAQAYVVSNKLASIVMPYLHVRTLFFSGNLVVMLRLDHDSAKAHGYKDLMVGCYDQKNQESISCDVVKDFFVQAFPAETELVNVIDQALPLRVDFDSGTAKLEMRFEIFNPTRLGFKVRKSLKDPKFQDIDNKELLGKQIVLELYPRLFNKNLNTLSGKVQIINAAGAQEHLGSVNLSESGDLRSLYSIN